MKQRHKWWEHIFFKYKEVKFADEIEEAERPRLWFTLVLILLAIIATPFVLLYFIFSFIKELIFPYNPEPIKKDDDFKSDTSSTNNENSNENIENNEKECKSTENNENNEN